MTVIGAAYDSGMPYHPAELARRPHFVYRCFDADGVLLYIGCTVHPEQRRVEHRRSSPWFAQLASVKLVGPFVGEKARDRALAAEQALICSERPLYVLPTGEKRKRRREERHANYERCDFSSCGLCRSRFNEPPRRKPRKPWERRGQQAPESADPIVEL